MNTTHRVPLVSLCYSAVFWVQCCPLRAGSWVEAARKLGVVRHSAPARVMLAVGWLDWPDRVVLIALVGVVNGLVWPFECCHLFLVNYLPSSFLCLTASSSTFSHIHVPTPQVLQGFYLRICKAAVNHHCLQVKVNVTHENGFAQFGGLS